MTDCAGKITTVFTGLSQLGAARSSARWNVANNNRIRALGVTPEMLSLREHHFPHYDCGESCVIALRLVSAVWRQVVEIHLISSHDAKASRMWRNRGNIVHTTLTVDHKKNKKYSSCSGRRASVGRNIDEFFCDVTKREGEKERFSCALIIIIEAW